MLLFKNIKYDIFVLIEKKKSVLFINFFIKGVFYSYLVLLNNK